MQGCVTFVGSGDAFGSGGRFNTCLHVDLGTAPFLVDLGSTSLGALKTLGIAYGDVETILVTHLHADHAGGIPSLLMESMIVTRRRRPLTIVGPTGLSRWIGDLGAIMYPGSQHLVPRFNLAVRELEAHGSAQVGDLTVRSFPMDHTPETHPMALRITNGQKTLAYTGDGAWSEAIVDLARGADLLVSECYAYDQRAPMHMTYRDIEANRERLEAARVILTHMGPDMLRHTADVTEQVAHDGLQVRF
jgi:ribonuclease BN (tRNA processing enzyme)